MKNYEAFKQKYQLTLNKQQEQALVRTNGQTLLLAVPGSGKTTVIISRIAYMLLVEKIAPGQILTLTFSRMGARDLKQRYQKSFPDLFGEALHFSTIHSFSLSVIRYYERIFRRQAHTVLGNSTPIIRELYLRLFKEYPGEIELGEICQRIGFCKNMMLTDDEIRLLPDMEVDFPKIFEAYETYKLTEQLMDFDDILKYAWTLLKKYPQMLEFFQEKYPYIHLDEAQDSSKIQFKIIELLTGETGNLFMVGDEDQSIYGFRGAFPESLLKFKETWPKGEVLLMETNYRSTRQIVEKANAFIKLNHERYQKEMKTSNEPGIPIAREWVKSSEAQYRLIIEAIRREGKEMAVLYRNNESAIPLVDLLDFENIPYQIKEHSPQFFTHYLIKDIQMFYDFACNPGDFHLFNQVYYKMDTAISKDTVAQVKRLARPGENAFDVLMRAGGERQWQIKRFRELKDGFKRLKKAGPQVGIEMILDELGYKAYLNFRISSGQSEENINQKLAVLKILGGRVPDFPAFFEKLKRLEEKLKEPQKKDARMPWVTLTTFHSSKGLEFEKVMIIDATEGQIPGATTGTEDEKRFAEEVRLFYVAATRAKKELIFLCQKNSSKGVQPSPFIGYLLDGLPKQKKIGDKRPLKSSRTKESFGTGRIKWQDYQNGGAKLADVNLSAYQKGTTIAHERFGSGTILERNGQLATINFETAGKKKMNLAVCLENGVIR